MGWANCGEDSKGRSIGYAHDAICDHPDCNEEIDRGLSYACGGMHGNKDRYGNCDVVCEGYFCGKHLVYVTIKDCYFGKDHDIEVCQECAKTGSGLF